MKTVKITAGDHKGKIGLLVGGDAKSVHIEFYSGFETITYAIDRKSYKALDNVHMLFTKISELEAQLEENYK